MTRKENDKGRKTQSVPAATTRIESVEVERRAVRRVYTSLPATFEADGQIHSGRIQNMNSEGAFLESSTLFPAFTILKNLRFTLPTGTDVTIAETLVVWHNEKELSSLYPCGMGVFYQVVEPSQVDLIKDFVSRSAAY